MLETHGTKFPQVLVIVPKIHADERGYFKEVFAQNDYERLGIGETFVQDNVSCSTRGVLRGMHYDLRMAKLVQCLDGAVYDVVVDMREGSLTFKQWDAIELSACNHRQIYVPKGFAHGFYVLSESATVLYKQTARYDPAHERGIGWRDPSVAIEWPLDGKEPLLSPKDAAW